MQTEFIGSPINNIDEIIQDLLKNSTKVSIAASYIKSSGLKKINKSIEECKNNGGLINFITTFDFNITDPEALTDLLDLDISCNLLNENFHPKLYIFENNEQDITAIIGSSNLSEGGLSSNYEANIILKGNIFDSSLKDVIEYYSYLQSKSKPIDKKMVELYSEVKIKELINETNDEKSLNELMDYLNQIPFSMNQIDEDTKELINKAQTNLDEGWDLYKKGEMDKSLRLIKESYNNFSLIINTKNPDNNECIIGKINSLLKAGWILKELEKSKVAQSYVDKAEEISKSINEKCYLESLALGAMIRGTTKEANEKSDKFLKIWESNKSSFENYTIIGQVYQTSAECKEKINYNLAYKHSLDAIQYIKQGSESSDSNFSRMIDNFNIFSIFCVSNNIRPSPDFDIKYTRPLLEESLRIAKEELKSEFWTATANMELGYCLARSEIPNVEARHYFNIAKKTFEKLGHNNLVEEINEYSKELT